MKKGNDTFQGLCGQKFRGYSELSDFKRQRGNQSPLGGWVGFASLEIRLSTEGKVILWKILKDGL